MNRWKFACTALPAGLLLALSTTTAAEPGDRQTLTRYVTFRDGSVLNVAIADRKLPVKQADDDGKVTGRSVKLSRVARLRLSPRPAVEQLARIKAWVTDLGNDEFAVRERATAELTKHGGPFRELLKKLLDETRDAEVAFRLEDVLKATDTGGSGKTSGFDVLAMDDADTVLQGDVGKVDWTARWRGHEITLARKAVAVVSVDRPETGFVSTVPQTRRIKEDRDALFPEGVTRIDFEKDPAGRPLKIGEDISRRFIAAGFTINTSIEGAIVSANGYTVAGRSKGQSCATHRPQWEGTLTVRFCMPGNERIAAGVRYVGFWVAAVAPNGTALQAYDARGERIAEVKTTRSGNDFLALQSSVPIASIKVAPNPAIDSNYTIDDLVFDTPRPMTSFGHAKLFVVTLHTGERLQAKQFSATRSRITLTELSVGVEGLSIDAEDVAAIATPLEQLTPAATAGDVWVLQRDGTRLIATWDTKRQVLATARASKMAIPLDQIAAVWSADAKFREPKGDEKPGDGELVVLRDDGVERHDTFRLAKAGFIKADGKAELFAIDSKHVAWLAPVNTDPQARGEVTLTTGERLVLGDDTTGWRLTEWSGDDVTLQRDKQRVELNAGEIVTLRLPRTR